MSCKEAIRSALPKRKRKTYTHKDDQRLIEIYLRQLRDDGTPRWSHIESEFGDQNRVVTSLKSHLDLLKSKNRVPGYGTTLEPWDSEKNAKLEKVVRRRRNQKLFWSRIGKIMKADENECASRWHRLQCEINVPDCIPEPAQHPSQHNPHGESSKTQPGIPSSNGELVAMNKTSMGWETDVSAAATIAEERPPQQDFKANDSALI